MDRICSSWDLDQLLNEARALEEYRRASRNLYERVRALFFLHALNRYHIPTRIVGQGRQGGTAPFAGYELLLGRRFEEAIDVFLHAQSAGGPSDVLCSALALCYQRLGFQTLADQVRECVRSARGNNWMFRVGHPYDQPLRIKPELVSRGASGTYPILCERTPVRMDLSHAGWSDIFFLGMDYPEGARVLNVSVDLAVVGRDTHPQPPVEAYLRVIDEPVLRLTSVDLGVRADLTELTEVFDFAKDYLGLLKAALIASGIIPPGMEGSGSSLAQLLARVVGEGCGLELVTHVHDIPKGSRLAVSTSLLACIVSVCMRATGQAASLSGPLADSERRLVLSRALLGEWLGGSGGGWQDSGGVWPGIKLIEGVLATPGDVEWGVSRGCLMPRHQILGPEEIPATVREGLQRSLVLVHGGMAQNVGPILEMVTERYLLRSEREWLARRQALALVEEIVEQLKNGRIREVARSTMLNFEQPIQTIIPWASNSYTERLIREAHSEFNDDFWGFCMLGGMSGGGMGFLFAPDRKPAAEVRLLEFMKRAKADLCDALPFAMDPVVYDFRINSDGTVAEVLDDERALMPSGYYALWVPLILRCEPKALPKSKHEEIRRFANACRSRPDLRGMVRTIFDAMLPGPSSESNRTASLASLLDTHGFDRIQHEQIRTDLRAGRLGLAQNRLPANTVIESVDAHDLMAIPAGSDYHRQCTEAGRSAIRDGRVAVVTLAGGVGSRWTHGAGVVKALNPFCKFRGKHRTFLEVHLAKNLKAAKSYDVEIPHIVTTSYLTHSPIVRFLERRATHSRAGCATPSPSRAIGQRLVPMVRDLRFLWEATLQQMLDEQQQKVLESTRAALIRWAETSGEGADYVDNDPIQCIHPVGHWYELANLLLNGVLAATLRSNPSVSHLLLHNIDTLGADIHPAAFGAHLLAGNCLTFEVISRRIDDRGGGLARVDGRLRLVEGLAMPREEIECSLAFYNSMTTWIAIDSLLQVFGLTRAELADSSPGSAFATTVLPERVRRVASRVPTYITLKEVKRRWGHGHEDVYLVAQFEKLWSDMTALPDVRCGFLPVSRFRGQQLKDPAQLDGWYRDGSFDYVSDLCEWQS